MYDKAKFKACVDWFKADRDALLPEHYGKPPTFVFAADSEVVDACASIGRTGRDAGIVLIVR